MKSKIYRAILPLFVVLTGSSAFSQAVVSAQEISARLLGEDIKINMAAVKGARSNTDLMIEAAIQKGKPLTGAQMVDAFDIFYARSRYIEYYRKFGVKNQPPDAQVIWLDAREENDISELTEMISKQSGPIWAPNIRALDRNRSIEQLTVALRMTNMIVLDGAIPDSFTSQEVTSVIGQLLVLAPKNSMIIVIDRLHLFDRLMPHVASRVSYVNLHEETSCNEKMTGKSEE